MIIGNINDTAAVEQLHPAFKTAFEWIRENITRAAELVAEKRVYIDGTNLFVNIDLASLRTKEEQLLEAHCKYIDIHVPISKSEIIGWKKTNETTNNTIPYDESADFAMYRDIPTAYYTLNQCDYCILYPTDAHAPIIGEGELLKFCVKVKVL